MATQNVPTTTAVKDYVRSNTPANYDATATYAVDDLVIDDGNIYKSLTAANIGNDPSADSGTNWQLIEKEYADNTAIVFAIALG